MERSEEKRESLTVDGFSGVDPDRVEGSGVEEGSGDVGTGGGEGNVTRRSGRGEASRRSRLERLGRHTLYDKRDEPDHPEELLGSWEGYPTLGGAI